MYLEKKLENNLHYQENFREYPCVDTLKIFQGPNFVNLILLWS